jgi:hypothetical protein
LSRFIVLDVVEGLVERQDLEDDLRRQLRETEACLRSLKADMAKLSTGDDADSFLPINAHAMLGDSDTGTILRS